MPALDLACFQCAWSLWRRDRDFGGGVCQIPICLRMALTHAAPPFRAVLREAVARVRGGVPAEFGDDSPPAESAKGSSEADESLVSVGAGGDCGLCVRHGSP